MTAPGAGKSPTRPAFVAYLECGILAHGFLRLTCDGCARDTLKYGVRVKLTLLVYYVFL